MGELLMTVLLVSILWMILDLLKVFRSIMTVSTSRMSA